MPFPVLFPSLASTLILGGSSPRFLKIESVGGAETVVFLANGLPAETDRQFKRTVVSDRQTAETDSRGDETLVFLVFGT